MDASSKLRELTGLDEIRGLFRNVQTFPKLSRGFGNMAGVEQVCKPTHSTTGFVFPVQPSEDNKLRCSYGQTNGQTAENYFEVLRSNNNGLLARQVARARNRVVVVGQQRKRKLEALVVEVESK